MEWREGGKEGVNGEEGVEGGEGEGWERGMEE